MWKTIDGGHRQSMRLRYDSGDSMRILLERAAAADPKHELMNLITFEIFKSLKVQQGWVYSMRWKSL